jgi:hypothetical protein
LGPFDVIGKFYSHLTSRLPEAQYFLEYWASPLTHHIPPGVFCGFWLKNMLFYYNINLLLKYNKNILILGIKTTDL